MASRSDRFIASCASWDEFYRRASALSNDEKGRHFERLVQLYLQTQPEYRTKLADVWLQRDVPADVRKTINLPQLDEGIDLIGLRAAWRILGNSGEIPHGQRQAPQSPPVGHLHRAGR